MHKNRFCSRGFTLFELLTTLGISVLLLSFILNSSQKTIASRQLSTSIQLMEEFLTSALMTVQWNKLRVRLLYEASENSPKNSHRFFMLTASSRNPENQWKLVRCMNLAKNCWFLKTCAPYNFPIGKMIKISQDWIEGLSLELKTGEIPVYEWILEPSQAFKDEAQEQFWAIGIGYGKNPSQILKKQAKIPIACLSLNINDHIQIYEGTDEVQNFLKSL